MSTIVSTPGRQQSKTIILSMSVDQKSLETEFSFAICRQTGNKWQSKTLFLKIFDPCSRTVKSVFDCGLPIVVRVKKLFIVYFITYTIDELIKN